MAKKAASRSRNTAPSLPHDWRAHEDLHHLKNAEQVRADPKRHAAAIALAGKEKAALGKIARRKA